MFSCILSILVARAKIHLRTISSQTKTTALIRKTAVFSCVGVRIDVVKEYHNVFI